MTIQWILHKAVCGDRLSEFIEILNKRKDLINVLEKRTFDIPMCQSDIPVIGLVSISIASRIYRNNSNCIPGVFWTPHNFDQTIWSSYLGKFMLNNDILWIPWAEFIRRGELYWKNIFLSDSVFIRPNTGQKIFTGQNISLDNLSFNAHILEQTSGLIASSLIGVSSVKKIDNDIEWRFWVDAIDKKILSHSMYSWNNDKKYIEPPIDVTNFVQDILEYSNKIEFYPSDVFVMDICYSNNDPKLIELNSASCSGLYQADLHKLVDGLANRCYTIYNEYKNNE